MAITKPKSSLGPADAEKRAVIIDHGSWFTPSIANQVLAYNRAHPGDEYRVDTFDAGELSDLADVGPAERAIYTGGPGDTKPVKGEVSGAEPLYICYSHQWKAEQEGGKVERLHGTQQGVKEIDVHEDDYAVGPKGKLDVDKAHSLAVTKAPSNAKPVATSEQVLKDGSRRTTYEALRYDDGSLSVQFHPEGGKAAHVIHNYLSRDYREAA